MLIKFSLIVFTLLFLMSCNSAEVREVKSDKDRYIKYKQVPKDYTKHREFNNSLILNP